MEMMKTCCSEVKLNLESLSNYNFLNEIFFSYFIYNFGQKLIKTKKNKRNCFNFVYHYQIIRIVNFCVKTEKEPFNCILWKFYTNTKKIENFKF